MLKHGQLSLISVINLLYLIIIGTFYLHMLIGCHMENPSLITCILSNQGYFGHFDYLFIFICRGVPRGPHKPLGLLGVQGIDLEGKAKA